LAGADQRSHQLAREPFVERAFGRARDEFHCKREVLAGGQARVGVVQFGGGDLACQRLAQTGEPRAVQSRERFAAHERHGLVGPSVRHERTEPVQVDGRGIGLQHVPAGTAHDRGAVERRPQPGHVAVERGLGLPRRRVVPHP
jgi:hypothetical protein